MSLLASLVTLLQMVLALLGNATIAHTNQVAAVTSQAIQLVEAAEGSAPQAAVPPPLEKGGVSVSTAPADGCSPNPCENGGSCSEGFDGDAYDGFTCTCPSGYSGDECQTPLPVPTITFDDFTEIYDGSPIFLDPPTSTIIGLFSFLSSNPSVATTSGDGGNVNYVTILSPGTTTITATEEGSVGISATGTATAVMTVPSLCSESLCGSYGSDCTLGTGGNYSCTCDYPGLVGASCDVAVDYCAAMPCGENGVCVRTSTIPGPDPPLNSYSCSCDTGYYGNSCQYVGIGPLTVSITPTSTSLLPNATTSFSATVTNSGGNTGVTWSALYGTIDASGTYTAPPNIGTSSIIDTITATSQADDGVTATATVTVSSDLAGWWPLDEGSGATAYDQSGNGNDAAWAGSQLGTSGYYASDTFSGSPSYAGYFDGSDDSVSEANIPALEFGTGDFSVSFWLRASQWGGVTQGVVGQKANDGDNGWQIYNDSGTDTSDIGMRIGDTQQTFYSNSSVTTDAWQLWTFVRENGVGYWYLNGAQDASSSFAFDASSATGTFSIGYAQTWGAYYNGDIGDVRVYGRALSPAEVEDVYNLGQPSGGQVDYINPGA